MTSQKNVPLILALALPVALILVVLGTIHVPRLFAPEPQYKFVYQVPTQGFDYRQYRNYYGVENGALVRKSISTPYPQDFQPGSPPLYTHDVMTNKSTQLSFEDAQKLKLDSSPESPDGYTIECGRRSDAFFVFFVDGGTDCSRQVLVGHNTTFKVNTISSQNDYHPIGQSFLGWVIPE